MDTNNMDHGASERGGAGAAASEQCGEAAANEQGGEAAAGCCQGGIRAPVRRGRQTVRGVEF